MLRVKGGVGPETPSRGFDRLLLRGGVGPKAVLDPVGELGEDLVGDVGGLLGDEVDAYTLGAD